MHCNYNNGSLLGKILLDEDEDFYNEPPHRLVNRNTESMLMETAKACSPMKEALSDLSALHCYLLTLYMFCTFI